MTAAGAPDPRRARPRGSSTAAAPPDRRVTVRDLQAAKDAR